MRTTFFTAIMFSFLTFPANASEHHIFYSVSVEGHRTVNLNLVSSDIARDLDFDVDVVISAVEKDASGTSIYVDRSRHLASVRCGAPAKVKVRGTDYKVDSMLSAGIDWKHDLWISVCMSPMS